MKKYAHIAFIILHVPYEFFETRRTKAEENGEEEEEEKKNY